MTLRGRAAATVRRGLTTAGFEVRRVPTFDRDFSRWIREAESRGVDPNDLGDDEWRTDLLNVGLREVYGPVLGGARRVLELGPGSGRLTRHLVGMSREVIVADRSVAVCKWMSSYLEDKGPHRVIRIDEAAVPTIESESVDAVVAHGVFEHLDLDVAYWFLVDFHRMLRPGGHVAFNFDTPLSPDGIAQLQRTSTPSRQSWFRFHSPEAIAAISIAAGFLPPRFETSEERIGFAVCRKRNERDSSNPRP